MGVGPLVVEVLLTFVVAAVVLSQYGNWYRHHLVVTVAVLVAWYFSMLIVFILPLDVSNTIYENCLQDHVELMSTKHLRAVAGSSVPETNFSDAALSNIPLDDSNETVLTTPAPPALECHKPWSLVPAGVFPVFWRIVYWTSQFLTWLILPLMQSYTKAGDFTVGTKLRSAVIDNAIYYGSYLLIVGILFLYILLTDLGLDGAKIRAIAASASNTWGLFWLVLLLGYGLVEVPRSLWYSASIAHTLHHSYFRAAKLSQERAESNERVNDLLQSMRALGGSVGPGHPLRSHMDVIENKIPTELLDRVIRQAPLDSPHADVPSEKALVRLHKQLIKALQNQRRVETQWVLLVEKIMALEDTHRNAISHDTSFKHSTPPRRHYIISYVYTPTMEWLWRCRVRGYLLRALAVCFALVSVVVVWSELTFFSTNPTISLFAVFVNLAKTNYDYFTIEVISSLSMAYIALCAYSTLFKIRVLNLYYLAPHHQTDEYSLIFSGMMLCRLTPPMCLNFLSLIHMDSHVIKVRTEETHYTQIMGHMDVIKIISDGFNIYFPMMIVALCLATYYSLGSRLLSALGFQQFMCDDDLTTDLIEEGKTLISRESRRRQRMEDNAARRKDFAERFGGGESSASMYRSARQRAEELVRPLKRDDSSESAQLELLGGSDSIADYSSRTTTSSLTMDDDLETGHGGGRMSGLAQYSRARTHKPDKGLFDDV
ncbi:LMBR1 domain-containing protein 2 homolog [Procambarus clarkii]|uniref:LMBR1 domain-containing protein 2 homolog n=1 Tax=Procambarus clarkii TaxID=6728 RepID=UPI001E6728D8|nr:LMBR1 domain-containing protein 2 homolog [Procambarus clarkii]XP_045607461.1 LMBR1 domain-containing protein 2 homolog [Procambarus clarkii]